MMKTYHVYVLKMRKMQNGLRPQWRFTLDSAETETQQHFTTLDALMTFLEQTTRTEDPLNLLFEPSQNGELR